MPSALFRSVNKYITDPIHKVALVAPLLRRKIGGNRSSAHLGLEARLAPSFPGLSSRTRNAIGCDSTCLSGLAL